MQNPGIGKLAKICAALLFSVMLAACGADNGDDDPAATEPASDAQPTVAVTEETEVTAQESPVDLAATASPNNIDMSTLPPVATPGSSEDQAATSEPVTPEAVGGDATPAASPAVGIADATPVGLNEEATAPDEGQESSATPEAGSVAGTGTQGDVAVGDGTTGAVIPGELATPAASDDAVSASTPVSTGATPVASPASETGSATPAAPLAVTGCEVEDVPPFAGEQDTFSLRTDLNFRAGPGAECDLALDVPLGEFQQVIVIGGPVVRSDDGSEWVQIQVGETIGWVALEFLEPVE